MIFDRAKFSIVQNFISILEKQYSRMIHMQFGGKWIWTYSIVAIQQFIQLCKDYNDIGVTDYSIRISTNRK